MADKCSFSNSMMALESKPTKLALSDEKKIKLKVNERSVCKFWIQNVCKKGENCEFLHENDYSKYPECPIYEKEGLCSKGRECPFKHTPKLIKDCPSYLKGYCKEGKNCKWAHLPKELCINYTLGFCPEGPNCTNIHVKSSVNCQEDNFLFLAKFREFDSNMNENDINKAKNNLDSNTPDSMSNNTNQLPSISQASYLFYPNDYSNFIINNNVKSNNNSGQNMGMGNTAMNSGNTYSNTKSVRSSKSSRSNKSIHTINTAN